MVVVNTPMRRKVNDAVLSQICFHDERTAGVEIKGFEDAAPWRNRRDRVSFVARGRQSRNVTVRNSINVSKGFVDYGRITGLKSRPGRVTGFHSRIICLENRISKDGDAFRRYCSRKRLISYQAQSD